MAVQRNCVGHVKYQISTPCQWSVSDPIFRPTNIFENEKNKQRNKHAHKIRIFFLHVSPFLIYLKHDILSFVKAEPTGVKTFSTFLMQINVMINFHWFTLFVKLCTLLFFFFPGINTSSFSNHASTPQPLTTE